MADITWADSYIRVTISKVNQVSSIGVCQLVQSMH